MDTSTAANCARETLLLPAEAARVVERITHRSMTADSLRYHEQRGRLNPMRTAGGVRLFRYGDVVDFARRLCCDDEPVDVAS